MMTEQQQKNDESLCFKIRLFTGIYLMSALTAMTYTWGNLNVYAVSYFHFRVNIDTASTSSWIIALNSMAWSIGLLLGVYISRYFGFRLVMVGSNILFSIAMFMCYYAIQTSFILLNALVGVVCGFTYGLSQCLSVNLLTIRTSPKRLGLAVSAVMLTQQLGSMVLSFILTRYVNPYNTSPDSVELKMKLFSQHEILDKVPYMFVVYGAIAFGAGVVATVLVWTSTPEKLVSTCSKNSKSKSKSKEESTPCENLVKKNDKENKFDSKLCQSYNAIEHSVQSTNKNTQYQKRLGQYDEAATVGRTLNNGYDVESELSKMRCPEYIMQSELESEKAAAKERNKRYQIMKFEQPEEIMPHDPRYKLSLDQDNITLAIHHGNDLNSTSETLKDYSESERKGDVFDKKIQTNKETGLEADYDDNANNKNKSFSQFSPKQVLKSRTFYTMAVMAAYTDISCLILNTYYKMFGLIHYPDDAFFTSMGIGLNVGALVVTLLTGMASDMFDLKRTAIGATAVLAVVSALFYLSALINNWFYLIVGVIFNGCSLSIYTLITICASRYFGKEVTTIVQGMALSSMYGTNIVMPIVADAILSSFGWMHLFVFVSCCNVIGLCVVVVGLDPTENVNETKTEESPQRQAKIEVEAKQCP